MQNVSNPTQAMKQMAQRNPVRPNPECVTPGYVNPESVNPESGAAHVNIFFFLIMLVLFLGALGFGYVTLEKNNELERIRNEAVQSEREMQDKIAIYEHYVDAVRDVVGETGVYKGKTGWRYDVDGQQVTSADAGIDKISIKNATLPSQVKEAMDRFAQSVKVPQTTGVSTLFGSVTNRISSLEQQLASLQTDRQTVQGELQTVQGSVAQITRDHDSRQRDLNSQLRQKEDDYAADIEEKDNTIRAANTEVIRIREEKSDMQAEHLQQVAALNKEIETLNARIDAAADKVRLINPADSPDGMVLEASQVTGLAWINLGRADMLPMGTTFEILKTGSDTVKAYGTVTRLEQTRSQVRITGLVDRFDPIVPGDQIRNDLFSPDMTHNIYLMGRFSQPYTRPLLKSLLENLGNRVVDELNPAVDLILVGGDSINEDGSGFTPIEESEEFKRAQFLRIEMAPLSKVRQYLRLTDDLISR